MDFSKIYLKPYIVFGMYSDKTYVIALPVFALFLLTVLMP